MKEAMLYQKLADHKVVCSLCAHRCTLAEEKFGICGVRQNCDGVLRTYAYDRIIAAHVDPIEKNPFITCCQVRVRFRLPLLAAIFIVFIAKITILLNCPENILAQPCLGQPCLPTRSLMLQYVTAANLLLIPIPSRQFSLSLPMIPRKSRMNAA